MQSNPAFHLFIPLIALITFSLPVIAQEPADTSKTNIEVPAQKDSISVNDTISNDTLVHQKTYLSKDAIKSKVTYKARDTIKYNFAESKVYLYNDAVVTYENIELKAAYIELRMDSDIVFAQGLPDSNGNIVGSPVFKEGAQEFRSQRMSYNFHTKKGKIVEIITQEGEGYIHGKDVKKTEEDIIYIENGMYTTCDLDHPHYSISAKKMKIIPDDKIVARPANLIIEDVPTPILLPFGIFPNRKRGKSGFTMPTPGESTTDGFFLWNLGYYIYLNEKSEVLVHADLYSKGSYTIRPTYNYKSIYKRSGSVNMRYKRTISGVIPEDPDYTEVNDYWFKWVHTQDPNAHPGSSFGADVDMGTQTSYRNDLNTSDQGYLTNNFKSSIRYSKTLVPNKINFSMSASESQNNSTGTFDLTLPDAALSVSRVNPFKTTRTVTEKWYHKIGVSYTGNFRNYLSMQNRRFSYENRDSIQSAFKNGISHSIPLSMNFKAFKFFTVNPNLSYREVWAFQSLEKGINPADSMVLSQQNSEFIRAGNYSASVGIATKIYGMAQSKTGYFRAIRHVMTPSVSFTYTPENRDDIRTYIDTAGRDIEYSIFEGGVYGAPGGRESGKIGFGLINILEMKVKTKSDTADGMKKIKLLENFRFGTGYDLIKDSLKWDNLSVSGYTNLSKSINLNFNASVDPYTLDSTGTQVYKVNRFEYDETGRLGRLTSASLALNFNFAGGTKKEQKDEAINTIGRGVPPVDWDIPWTLSASYSLSYSKPQYVENIMQSLTSHGDLSITKNWKVSCDAWFDLKEYEVSYARIGVHRNLHCWEMTMDWVPIGRSNFYNFHIGVKANILEGLKLEKKNL